MAEKTEATKRDETTIFLFDLDGTLTVPRQRANNAILAFLKALKERVVVGIVSGSNVEKILEQLNLEHGIDPDKQQQQQQQGTLNAGTGIASSLYMYTDYLFAENGTVARYLGQPLGSDASILEFLGEEKLQQVINFCLRSIADLAVPVKRGTFIEYRSGMLNISPIGRNCSASERIAFFVYDQKHHVRRALSDALRRRFGHWGLEFSIGGQISIDCFPTGWDKRYALQYLEGTYSHIYFFGDRTAPGGNDYEIFSDSRTKGYSVESPEDTMRQVASLLSVALPAECAEAFQDVPAAASLALALPAVSTAGEEEALVQGAGAVGVCTT